MNIRCILYDDPVDGGKLAGVGAQAYSEGDALRGSDEAAKFKK